MPILNGIYADTPFDTKEILQADLNIANKYRSNPLRWKGQFSPQLVQVFLDNYSNRDTTVFDPFLGSGTVLLESGIAGLKASGTEINPAAAMLAQTYHLINLPVDSRRSHLQAVSSLLHAEFLPSLPLFQNIDEDQDETNFEAIKLKLVGLLSEIDDRFQRGLLETLITLLDFYQTDISVKKVFKIWTNFRKLVVELPFSCQPIKVFLSDAREVPLSDSSVNLVITSPPYINVFNYHQQYRASMEALNWNLLKVSRSEFGANRKHRGNRFLTVVQFCLDMAQALSELARVCRPGARLILRLVLIRFFIDLCLCEDEVFEFHQRASETLIQENTEQTRPELIAHPGLKSPMRPRTHTPDRKLVRQLVQRRLNASAHPPVKFPKCLRILRLLIAAQRR